jgi:hypothetical protein
MKKDKSKAIFFKIWRFLGRGKRKGSSDLQFALELASIGPMNGNPPRKIAQIYQKQGQEQKAFQEYLTAAELLCDAGQYHEGVTICKKLQKEGSEMDLVRVKLKAACKKMELRDKGLEIQCSMEKSYPHKLGLNEKCNLNPGTDDQNRIGEATLVHSPETKISFFFDLAKKLEDYSSVELGKSKSITIKEIDGPGIVFKEFEKNREFRKTIS